MLDQGDAVGVGVGGFCHASQEAGKTEDHLGALGLAAVTVRHVNFLSNALQIPMRGPVSASAVESEK